MIAGGSGHICRELATIVKQPFREVSRSMALGLM
jgi:hypothetical protein